MRATRTSSFVAGLLAFTVAGCQDAPTSAVAPDLEPSFSVVGGNGMGAIVAPSCYGPNGTPGPTLVPVSDTDWWFVDAELVSSTCRTLPSGETTEQWSIRVLSDIPLPEVAHRASLADGNVFDIYVPGIGLVAEDVGLSCFSADGRETLDAVFITTPSGQNTNSCSFGAAEPF